MREIRTSGLTRGEALTLPYSTVLLIRPLLLTTVNCRAAQIESRSRCGGDI